jgi:hypothetical protein
MEILPNFDEDKSRTNVEATDVDTDETEWAMVDNAYELLYRGLHLEPWELNTPWRNITQGHGGFGKLSCWRDLAFIIRWAASPEKNDLPVEHEEELLARITASLRGWEQSFRMTREQSALQREWSGLLDALEVFWWLGYRKEAFEFAREVRNFSSDKEGISRFSRIVSWNPETEWSGYFPDGGPSFVENKDVVVRAGGYGFFEAVATNRGIQSNYLTSAAAWKIREVSLNYDLPAALLRNTKSIKGASVGFVARNLFTFLPVSNQWTDPEFANTTGNAAGVNNSSILPPNRLYGFNVTLRF